MCGGPRPGIYIVRNPYKEFHIIPDNGSSSGNRVETASLKEKPNEYKISLSMDNSGLYTLKSDSDLSVADSMVKNADGYRYLAWKYGDFKWVIRSAGIGLWNLKLPNDVLFAFRPDDITEVTLDKIEEMYLTRWEFQVA